KREGVKHNVLNAKHHEREADIVAQAGRRGAVTISTNMAGRGTDIVLGGNPEVLARSETGTLKSNATVEEKEAWQKTYEANLKKWQAICAQEKEDVIKADGLFILGTERHESRRIDNQLRGRSGRQGDPGESRFYLSFDDDLLRIFGQSDILKRTVQAMDDDVPIEHRWTTKAIENAQRKVEGHNYDIRKHLLEYDNVMNQQRKVIYSWRREVLARDNLREMLFSMVNEISDAIAQDFFPKGKLKRVNGQALLDAKELNDAVLTMLQVPAGISEQDIAPFNDKGLKNLIIKLAEQAYTLKEQIINPSIVRQLEKMIFLTTIDTLWKDHLLAMDHLREGIGLQGYGQKDPLIAYKKEGFRYFEIMMNQITSDVVRKLFAVQLGTQQMYQEELQGELQDELQDKQGESHAPEKSESSNYDLGKFVKQPRQMTLTRGNLPGNQRPEAPQPIRSGPKVGRNDPCPCGSGKKYKKCHGS
ncbi:MAG: SEC-C domain-containing protein, partial [Bdellovibrio sp.]|nr:SEC-C domain-containing protein [Bdellovibrio sp.]